MPFGAFVFGLNTSPACPGTDRLWRSAPVIRAETYGPPLSPVKSNERSPNHSRPFRSRWRTGRALGARAVRSRSAANAAARARRPLLLHFRSTIAQSRIAVHRSVKAAFPLARQCVYPTSELVKSGLKDHDARGWPEWRSGCCRMRWMLGQARAATRRPLALHFALHQNRRGRRASGTQERGAGRSEVRAILPSAICSFTSPPASTRRISAKAVPIARHGRSDCRHARHGREATPSSHARIETVVREMKKPRSPEGNAAVRARPACRCR